VVAPTENPPWSGWDVLLIALLTIVSVIMFLLIAVFAVQRFLYPNIPVPEVATYPLVTLLAQSLAYLLVLACMIAMVKRRSGREFLVAIRWNWPVRWPFYVLAGLSLSVVIAGLGRLLPIPDELPIDQFFRTPRQALISLLFGTTLGPLWEELFFRGSLYPVLARRLRVVPAVFVTSLSFSLIHVPQLKGAWAPVLLIFLVGLTLTITRAVTKSVAAGLLMHVTYNGTFAALMMFAKTDGFRHF
jgi:membrane protease YdiL (CAAX protease family)